MDWKATLIIGGFSLILCAVLLIPALLWTRRSGAPRSPKVRLPHVVAAMLVVVVLVTFVALHQFYPNHPIVWWLWRLVWLVVLPLLLWREYVIISRTKKRLRNGA
jgi:hydrogenase-4 membrane subunit HyfE